MKPTEYRQEYLIKFGEKVRQLRIERGLSQDDLAQLCGYRSRSSINKIEKGVYDLPLPKMKALADALGVEPTVFWSVDEPVELKDDEIQMAKRFARLNAYHKAMIEMMLKAAEQEEQKKDE